MTSRIANSSIVTVVRTLGCCVLLLLLQGAASAQPATARLNIPVRLNDVNFEVHNWRVSCTLSYPASYPAPPKREESPFQVLQNLFGWLAEIVSRLLGIGSDSDTPRPPSGTVPGMSGAMVDGLGLGFRRGQPDYEFSNSVSGPDRVLELPVPSGGPLSGDRRRLTHRCVLSFLLDDETGRNQSWVEVPEGEPGYAHPDVRLRAKRGFPLTTVSTGIVTSLAGHDVTPIVFTGAVTANDAQLDALDVFTLGKPLGNGPEPHPVPLVQYVAFACEPPWETDENGALLVDYNNDAGAAHDAYLRTLGKCTECHDARTWVPAAGAAFPALTFKTRVIEDFVETGEIIVGTGSQADVDMHPASIGVNCLTCHVGMASQREAVAAAPVGQIVLYGRIDDTTMLCQNCHGPLLKPWTARTLCGQASGQPREDHVPRGIWKVMELFDQYKQENDSCDPTGGLELDPGETRFCVVPPSP